DSPCINAGNNAYAMGSTDLDGRPRIAGGTVDMGAYEFQPGISGAFIGWLSLYALPVDGSADYADSDSDGLNNWQEWVAGTDPTNAVSVLRLKPPVVTPPGLLLRWSSDANHAYFVERAGDLGSPLSFRLLAADIPGLPDTTAYTDTTTTGLQAAYY